MTTPKRAYNVKDVDFLIAADTIIDSAIANQPFLETKRAPWTPAFFQEIKNRINQAVQDHLGMDSAGQLRQASQAVYTIANAAMRELAEVKVQIGEDFKDVPQQRTEILNTLGFTAFYNDAREKDQEALINLLYQFKTNLTPELNHLIVSKGTAPATLNAVIDRADALRQADVLQEGKKGARSEITATAVAEFNAIYEKIISIARISAKFYKDEPAKKDLFNFRKITKTINSHRS